MRQVLPPISLISGGGTSGNTSNNSSPLAHDENDFSRYLPPAVHRVPSPIPHPATSNHHQGTTTASNPLKLNDNNSKRRQSFSSLSDKPTVVVGQSVGVDTLSGGSKPSSTTGSIKVLATSPGRAPVSPRPSSLVGPSLSAKKRMIESAKKAGGNAVMTLSNQQHDVDPAGATAKISGLSPRKRDDNSLSSFNRERKEDDHALYPPHSESMSSLPNVRNARPANESSGRARGETPPRPGGHMRSTSNEGITETTQQRRSSRRSASPNRIPRVPNKQTTTAADGNSQTSSPRRFSNNKDQSNHSLASSGGGSFSKRSWAPPKRDPADHEQALFEQRLCEDAYGVAVRKISQNGKPNLRYVKCVYVDNDVGSVGDSHYPSSTRSSVSSFTRSFRKSGSSSNVMSSNNDNNNNNNAAATRQRVLTWGKKKDVRLPLERFVCVRKGKTTERARRNGSPSCRILSLITTDPNHQSLDIEAPTRLDRDKFARAFARFLDVPLVGEDKTAQSVSPRTETPTYKKTAAMSEPDLATTPKQTIAEAKRIQQYPFSPHNAPLPVVMAGSGGSSTRHLKVQTIDGREQPLRKSSQNDGSAVEASSHSNIPNPLLAQHQVQIGSLPSSLRGSERSSTQAATASRPTDTEGHDDTGEDASQVSSLTGAGFDQEIVEELHQALTELKAELEESRAEAARAVKVAEQAIQSAENSNSNDWNSTVTHKAAEAAALAQKKSAEAMAKQRLAEERLEAERRTAAYWRRQAEAAEEEASILQTRAAAAEVQRAAMAEELVAERRRTTTMVEVLKSQSGSPTTSPKSKLRLSQSATTGGEIFDVKSELALLKEKLALESAARRKLLHEVQDLRGVVRVYCRPRQSPPGVKGILSIPSQETLLLHPYDDEPPVSFKFDRVFSPESDQSEVYDEVEELCLSVLDGFNICILAHGQRGSGKTYSMLGQVDYLIEKTSHVDVDIKDQGIHLRTVQQLFSISEHRRERYQDTFTLEVIEVHNERLHDLLAGTEIGESRGHIIMEDSKVTRTKRGMSMDEGSAAGLPQLSNSHSVSSKQGSSMTKLEIRTNQNGDTVVQGALSVEVRSFEDVCNIWKQCLAQRAARLADQGASIEDYEASSHVIATLSVTSVNSSTGMGSAGKIKFVDLAGADLVQRRNGDQKLCSTPDSNAASSSNSDWRYANRSLATLNDVVNCRSQFMRSVPYRNSTLTHLLCDNLEADTKVLLLLCVSAQAKDLPETACALRFASGMRRVNIGKATKHSINRQEQIQ